MQNSRETTGCLQNSELYSVPDWIMSTRVLRKLHNPSAIPDVTGDNVETHDNEEDDRDAKECAQNRFHLLNDDDDNVSTDDINSECAPVASVVKSKQSQPKKKKKSKKPVAASVDLQSEELSFSSPTDGISCSIDLGENSSSSLVGMGDLLKITHRYLDAEGELKRFLGSKSNKNKSRYGTNRGRVAARLVQPKTNWPALGGTGLSMELVKRADNNSGEDLFAFHHSNSYQRAQNLFWNAVDSMVPEMFVNILQEYPYHVDSLLQLSEVVRANEDFQMARDLVERALYACECAFHPLFNLNGNCRLDYKQAENRPFYLALCRHMVFLMQRGCYRTALEFCKLIYSLDPREDPLGMLLIIDFFSLKAKEYDYIAFLFSALEASRNLSLLPSFAFSLPLAEFLKNDCVETEKAAHDLRTAVMKFPSLLMPLLDKCGVAADTDVESCPLFSATESQKDAPGLRQLIQIYVSRCFTLWKDKEALLFLERTVRAVVSSFASEEKLISTYREIRNTRYRGAPRNIARHILVCDLPEAMTVLPQDIRDRPIMSYDPLPPSESRRAYERPQRTQRRVIDDSTLLSSFIRSLVPNYNPEAPAPEVEELEGGAVGGEPRAAAADLQMSVRTLLNAVRDLLGNIEPTAAPREDSNNANEFVDSDSE